MFSEVKHHRCLPHTYFFLIKSKSGSIMAAILALARLLLIVYEHKVSITHAVPLLSTAAEDY